MSVHTTEAWKVKHSYTSYLKGECSAHTYFGQFAKEAFVEVVAKAIVQQYLLFGGAEDLFEEVLICYRSELEGMFKQAGDRFTVANCAEVARACARAYTNL